MRNTITYRGFTFPAKKIARATIGLEQSLPILTLGIDTFEAEVKCTDPTIEDFQQNEPVVYTHRKKQMGIYYLQSVERVSPDHYTLSAVSTLGLLEQMDFYGGIYTGETVVEVVAAICGTIPYIIKSNLQNIKLYGWLGIMSARLALQQVLFAIGANLVTDTNGVLRIENLWDGISGVLGKDKIYMEGASVKRDPPVTSVTVLEHQYIPGTEHKDLFEGTTLQGQRIPFDGPMSDLSAEGFTILESGANYAVVSAGSGKLTGVPYIHTTMEVTKSVTNAPVKNEERLENATLVSLVNSNAVAERLAAYYACRRTIQASARIQREHPGQVVQIYNPFDKKMVQAAIATSDVNASGVLRSDLTALVGFAPAQTDTMEYYDDRIVLSGLGQWVPPEGVSEITVVAIGKGNLGSPGSDGTAGQTTILSVSLSQRKSGGTYQINRGAAGKGGAGGSGGLGGKIYRATMQIADRAPITYDTTGDEAIFGEITSAAGAASDTGFLDPITGEILGSKGDIGLDGGDGGLGGVISGGNAKGEDGGSVAPWVGGTGDDSVTGKYGPTSSPTETGYFMGAGGGGAAYGANGSAGITSRGGVGYAGDGASATSPPPETTIGKGGRGGGGGGGGGGAGAAAFVCKGWPDALTGLASRCVGGAAGKGAEGNEGGPAGVILYFKNPKKSPSGALVTKDHSFFCDASGRLIIT